MTLRLRLWYLAGMVSLLAGWHLTAITMGEMVLATPLHTLAAFCQMLLQQEFWEHLSISAVRLFYALSIASIIGLLMGLVAGRIAAVKMFLEPLRWLLMSVPPVIVVLLAMLWLGMGTAMVVFITTCLLMPAVYVNTQKGVESIDHKWIELAQAYRFSIWQKVTAIYLPAISPSLAAALVLVCCNGVRILVLAEVLGTHNGLGYQVANARSAFNSAELYAWVLMSLLIVAWLEFFLLGPIQKAMNRWQTWR